ncbi:MAG: hypothetical protein CSB24_04025 [Deltaproteobacteria bacterium]|nr:MAG: hypothetical protein CSB24_04025 [Deltaproteobacteria bacterium]
MNINTPFLSRLIQIMIFLLSTLALIMPRRIWLFFGGLLGRFCHLILKNHRQYALANVAYALGGLPRQEQKAIVKKNFILLGVYLFEMLRYARPTDAILEKNEKNIEFAGWEHFETARKTGKGILLLTGHFGFTELINMYYVKKTGRKLNFIMRHFDNHHLQKMFTAHSTRFGIRHLHKKNGLRPAIRNITRGEDLIIFPDQSSNLREGVNSTIFGRPAVTLSLLPSLAKRFGLPILPVFIFIQDDMLRHKIVFFPPIMAGDEDSIETLTQKQNDVIEKAIRMKPEQWLWLHRRWKREKPELYRAS